ncbi:MAG TPA: outer membrane beta-barrel protein [Puia sp.]|nr:outer membrane beta-barrel protein [Puia sp.]
MHKLLLILIVSTLTLTASAQHLTLSINGGASIPTGSFAKGDYADPSSGFAGTGGHFNITGAWSLSKHWSIQALVGYSGLGSKGAQSLSDGYKEDSGTDSTTLYRKGSNHVWSFLAGPRYSIDAGKKLTLSARVLIGYVHTHLAGFQIFYEDYTDNAMTQQEASGGAFGGQAGLGLAYHLTKKLSIQINGDYVISKPNIPIHYEDFIVNSGRRLNTYNQSLAGVNATLGLAYTLF